MRTTPPTSSTELMAELTTDAQELRERFEKLVSDPSRLRRSRRGTYVTPSVARDWKWFRLGAADKTERGQK